MGVEKQPLSARILVTVFLAPFLLITALMMASPFVTVALAVWTYAWEPVDCSVEQSSIEESEGRFGFQITYRYGVHGVLREGHTYARGYEPAENPLVAEGLLERLPEGTETVCFVNPTDPGEAVLERGNVGMTVSDLVLTFVAGFAFFAPLAFVFYAVHFNASFQRLTSEPQVAARGVLMVLAGGSLFVGGMLFYAFVWKPAVLLADSRTWTESTCTIVRSEVTARETTVRSGYRSPSGGQNTTTQTLYGLDLEYRYEAAGRELSGRRYRFFDHSAGEAVNRAIAERYSPGQEVSCFYDPDDPSSVVLDRSVGLEVLWAGVPVLFLAVGFALAVWSRRLGRLE